MVSPYTIVSSFNVLGSIISSLSMPYIYFDKPKNHSHVISPKTASRSAASEIQTSKQRFRYHFQTQKLDVCKLQETLLLKDCDIMMMCLICACFEDFALVSYLW